MLTVAVVVGREGTALGVAVGMAALWELVSHKMGEALPAG